MNEQKPVNKKEPINEQKPVIIKKSRIIIYVIISIVLANFLTANTSTFLNYLVRSFVLAVFIYEIIICTVFKNYFKKTKKEKEEKKVGRFLSVLVYFVIFYYLLRVIIYFVFVSSMECAAPEPSYFRTNVLTGSCEYVVTSGECSREVSWLYRDGCTKDTILEKRKNFKDNFDKRKESCNRFCLNGEKENYCFDYAPDDEINIYCDLITSCEKIKCKN